DLLERPTRAASKELRGLAIGDPRDRLDLEDVAVHLREVDDAVEVEVLEERSERDAIERPLTDSDLERTLVEVTTAFLDMKRRRLAREVADHDGETPFVRPRRVDPHPRERGAVPVGREARCEPQILERAVATIAEEEVRHGIVRDEDVGKPIAVDILDDDTERLAAKPGDAGELGDVLESPVALASKQKRRLRRKHGDGAILLRP